MPEAEREAVRRWAETLANRMAHLPSIGLRDLAFEVGPAAVETFFRSSEIDAQRTVARVVDGTGAEVREPEALLS